MADTSTNKILTMPDSLVTNVWSKASSSSTLANLCPQTPMTFGPNTTMVFNDLPVAEFVGEGKAKAPTGYKAEPIKVTPIKAQVTMRTTDEFRYMDDAHAMKLFEKLAEQAGIALGRALDIGAIAGLNPITGEACDLVSSSFSKITSKVELAANGAADQVVEAAEGVVIASGGVPTGISMDTAFAHNIATMRDSTGRKLYPDLGVGVNLTQFDGMQASCSNTVSAIRETQRAGKTATGILSVVGDFSAFQWGIMRDIPVHLIEYGDPDGLGDLARYNQVALRAEVFYGWAVLDADSFCLVKQAAATGGDKQPSTGGSQDES